MILSQASHPELAAQANEIHGCLGMRIIYSSLTPIHWIPCLTPLFLRGYPQCKLTITCRSPLVHSHFAPATGTAYAALQYSLLLVSTDRKENWWQMMKYVSCVSPPLSPQCSDLPSAERSYVSADFTVAKANIYIMLRYWWQLQITIVFGGNGNSCSCSSIQTLFNPMKRLVQSYPILVFPCFVKICCNTLWIKHF